MKFVGAVGTGKVKSLPMQTANTEPSTIDSLEERLNQMAQAELQAWFEQMVKTLPHLPMPEKVLVINDLHAAAGTHDRLVDPLESSCIEPAVLDLLDSHQDYVWVVHEVWDLWRGYEFDECTWNHMNLWGHIDRQSEKRMYYNLLSNHVLGSMLAPSLQPALIMEGYNKKFFFFHGHQGDWPNDEGWRIGRSMVRMADELGLDPESSPHPSNADRHFAVRQMWKKLADDNPEYTFVCGHSHYQENPWRFLVDDKGNKITRRWIDAEDWDSLTMVKIDQHNGYWNSGSPLNGKLEHITITDGEIQLHG